MERDQGALWGVNHISPDRVYVGMKGRRGESKNRREHDKQTGTGVISNRFTIIFPDHAESFFSGEKTVFDKKWGVMEIRVAGEEIEIKR